MLSKTVDALLSGSGCIGRLQGSDVERPLRLRRPLRRGITRMPNELRSGPNVGLVFFEGGLLARNPKSPGLSSRSGGREHKARKGPRRKHKLSGFVGVVESQLFWAMAHPRPPVKSLDLAAPTQADAAAPIAERLATSTKSWSASAHDRPAHCMAHAPPAAFCTLIEAPRSPEGCWRQHGIIRENARICAAKRASSAPHIYGLPCRHPVHQMIGTRGDVELAVGCKGVSGVGTPRADLGGAGKEFRLSPGGLCPCHGPLDPSCERGT